MKRVIVVGLVLILVISCFSLIGCKEKEVEPEGLEITIMSYNIRQDTLADGETRSWSVRKPYMIEQIKEQTPDIICMQEVKSNQNSDLAKGLEEYGFVWYSRSKDEEQEGLSIVYKKDKYELVSKDMFWLSETPNKESKGFGAAFLRICVHAVLKNIETQKEISVYSVHLEVMGKEVREKEINMILDRLSKDDKKAIVCGDFNATQKENCYKAIAEKMNSTQAVAKTTDTGITYQDFGASEDKLSFKDSIDFIFVDKDFYVRNFDILQEHKEIDGNSVYYSDHYAVKSQVIYKD